MYWKCTVLEAITQRCSVRKGVPRNFVKFTGTHLCQNLFFNKVAGLWPVFSCEIYKISKNTFSYRTPLMAASFVS